MASTWPELHAGTTFGYVWDVLGLVWIKAVPGSGTGGAGDASAANQVLQLAQETATATSVATLSANTPTVGQKTMAASRPVVFASDQSALPVTGNFWQVTQPVSGPLTDAQLRATAVPVSGTFWQVTQPVSIASMPTTPVTGTFWQVTQPISAAALPLPTGAATETTQLLQATATKQDTGNTSLASLDTKLTNPLPVRDDRLNSGALQELMVALLVEMRVSNSLLQSGLVVKDDIGQLRLDELLTLQ